MKKVLDLIEKEKDKALQRMLYDVYYNNLRYAKPAGLKRIIKAMLAIDRAFFVIPEYREMRYADEALPIGHGQTISQPSTVARMLLLLKLKPKAAVLEIGTGSGWNACLIAFITNGKVTTIERIQELSEQAQLNYKKLRKKLNIEFVFGDALDQQNKIWKQTYDRIVFTAAASPELQDELKKMSRLLRPNGLLLFPTEEAPQYGALELWQNKKGKFERIYREEGYVFVPLIKGR